MIRFTEKQKKKQDQQLREAFKYLNDRFFDGDISPNTIVRFAKCYNPKEKEPGDAHYLAKTEIIEIDEVEHERLTFYCFTKWLMQNCFNTALWVGSITAATEPLFKTK